MKTRMKVIIRNVFVFGYNMRHTLDKAQGGERPAVKLLSLRFLDRAGGTVVYAPYVNLAYAKGGLIKATRTINRTHHLAQHLR